jgi:hypothetical protein
MVTGISPNIADKWSGGPPIEAIEVDGWYDRIPTETKDRAVDALERGKVLFFPHLGFDLNASERRLLSADVVKGDRKNITLDPATGKSHGSNLDSADTLQLEAMLARFAECIADFVHDLFPAYVGHLERARTTFRAVEILGRNYSPRKDDRLLHVDTFPSRPTGGRRILRVFSNVNPTGKPRIWQVGQNFEDFAAAFLPRLSKPSVVKAWVLNRLRVTKGARTGYDQLMLQLHDRGKLDAAYQTSAPRYEIAFPPNSTWMCFTDQVLHAALSGQFALEQTFHIDVTHMVVADRSPIKMLERMTGLTLASPIG